MLSVSNDVPRIYGAETRSPCILIEGVRTNLVLNSEGTTAQLYFKGGNFADVGPYLNFANFISLSNTNGTVTTATYYSATGLLANTTYAVSVFCYMADGGVPNANDFRLVIGSNAYSITGFTQVYGRVYRAWTVVSSGANVGGQRAGVIKYTYNSLRDVFVSGMQIEAASFLGSYIPTSGGSLSRVLESFTCDGAASRLQNRSFALNLAIYRSGITPPASPRPVFIELATSSVSSGVPRVNFGLDSSGRLVHSGMQNDGATVIGGTVLSPLKTGWECITMNVRSSGTADVFLNGVLQATLAYPTGLYSGIAAIRLGGSCAVNGWEAFTELAPGAPGLGIPFFSPENLASEAVPRMHQRWLDELARIKLPA